MPPSPPPAEDKDDDDEDEVLAAEPVLFAAPAPGKAVAVAAALATAPVAVVGAVGASRRFGLILLDIGVCEFKARSRAQPQTDALFVVFNLLLAS